MLPCRQFPVGHREAGNEERSLSTPPSAARSASALASALSAEISRFPVTVLASGHRVEITALTVSGRGPGPTVTLVSGLHGHELFTALFFRDVLTRLATVQDSLRGKLVMVPMASPPSFEWGTRATPQDHGDMNRLFPGAREGTLTQQLIHVLVDKVVRRSDLLLDYHSEPDAMNIRCTYARRPDAPYGKRVLEAALASGTPVIYAAPSTPTTLAGYAEQSGILALTPELGGPYPEERYHLDYGWLELCNLLRHVGALPGTPVVAERQRVVQEVAHVRPRAGGLFVPEAGFETLGTVAPGDRLLGRVISPYTFEELDALQGPYDQNLLMVVRGRASKVHPGDPAYIVGNAATAEVIDSRR
jgi:uncharacterized protein